MKKFILLSALLLTGCSVSDKQIARAVEVCEHHEGVAYIDGTFLTHVRVNTECKDGIFISTKVKGKPQ